MMISQKARLSEGQSNNYPIEIISFVNDPMTIVCLYLFTCASNNFHKGCVNNRLLIMFLNLILLT